MQQRRPRPAGGPADDEREFVERCRAGDPQALDRFFRAYAPRIERLFGRLVGATPDLEDLVQTTFVEAVRSFPRFRGEASVGTWLVRIAVHVAHHHLRRGVRRFVALDGLSPADEPAAEPSPEPAIDDRRLVERLHLALDRMSPKKRIAFLLFAVEGHSIAEVAALMDAGHAATKSRIWFARRELLAFVGADPVLAALAARMAPPEPREEE